MEVKKGVKMEVKMDNTKHQSPKAIVQHVVLNSQPACWLNFPFNSII